MVTLRIKLYIYFHTKRHKESNTVTHTNHSKHTIKQSAFKININVKRSETAPLHLVILGYDLQQQIAGGVGLLSRLLRGVLLPGPHEGLRVNGHQGLLGFDPGDGGAHGSRDRQAPGPHDGGRDGFTGRHSPDTLGPKHLRGSSQ